MTAATVDSAGGAARTDLGHGRVSLATALRSEWVKLRSLRSTWWALAATLVIIAGLGTLFAAVRAHRFGHGGDLGDLFIDPTEISLRGIFLGQLAVGVLGVLVISGEYATGMIRASLSAIPTRWPVLVAKAVVFAALTGAVAIVATLLAFTFGQIALHSTGETATLSTPGASRAVIGAAVYLVLIGLLGVGLGFLLRSTAGGIATLVGIVLVLPLLAQALPTPYSTDVLKYLPLTAGSQIVATTRADPSALGPWAGIGITGLYAAAALVAGLFALLRRDA